MSKFKKGSIVFLNCDIIGFLGHKIPEGTKGIVLDSCKESPYIQFDVEPSKNLHNANHLGADGPCWSVHKNYLKEFKYEDSNRYKLKQAIKETGISSRKLSHFAVGNESFFYNQTGPARFKEYGDISWSKLDGLIDLVDIAKERLNAKITQDEFDEREKLDLAAKTVDENNVPVVDLVKEAKDALDTYSNNVDIGNSDQEDYSRYVEQLQSQSIEKRDYRLRNYCCAFITILLLLAIYFFTK